MYEVLVGVLQFCICVVRIDESCLSVCQSSDIRREPVVSVDEALAEEGAGGEVVELPRPRHAVHGVDAGAPVPVHPEERRPARRRRGVQFVSNFITQPCGEWNERSCER